MKFINWFIFSSKDPSKIALTLKGGIPLLLLLLSFKGISIPNADIEHGIDLVVATMAGLTQLIAAAVTAVGFIRKVLVTAGVIT